MNVLEFMQSHLLFLDGGMGTLLQAEGLSAGELPERWNLSHPEVIVDIHTRYYDAGSHVVNTNTFGANLLKFSHEELKKIVFAAVENAKQARAQSASPQEKWVALDIGPTGRMLAPYGDLNFEEAVAIFAETVRLGVEAGVDLIFIETMNDSYETKAALLAAKEHSKLPVFVSNAYGEDGKLMTGASPAAMVAMLEGMGADAIGMNCSLGPKQLAPIAEEYLSYASIPVLIKPNAGLPKLENGKTVYDVTPGGFAEEVCRLIQKGVRIAGGCCGTTPAYIGALTKGASDLSPLPITKKEHSLVSSYTHAVSFGDRPILIGERINPTGKKRLKEALRAEDMDYILKEGITQEEHGAHVLDVNVGLPEIDVPAMLTRVVCELQAVVNLPLQLDSADPAALAAALRRYNGKAMINSVNSKRESMDAIFPLAKKYGGLIVALTLDEDGIPAKAEDRVAIARRIIAEATRYGIEKKDLIFDPLAMTVSADHTAARETLRAVRMIREELGAHTSLGVSNVSFGLPRREIVTSTFFALAMENGLSAAIMNPYSLDMQKAYAAFLALDGQDARCADYIAFATALPEEATGATTTVVPTAAGETAGSELQRAIVKGLKEAAATLTRTMLASGTAPLAIVEREIIPALDTVGVGFEKKTVYLPQLLMSAEAAETAFAEIKRAMPTESATDKYTIVLATVKGDIHDIGKNIVKLLLENYGFRVVDLGRDVPPEAVVEAALRHRAPLVGLSALMTTTVPAMEETVRLLHSSAPDCKIMVGGAVLTQEYATKMGADAYAKDAMGAVRYAESLL